MRFDFKGRPRTWQDTDHDISSEQTEFARELRIPFLTSAYPRWNYITGIVVGTGFAWSLSLPTDEEVTLVAEFLKEYNDHYYNQSFVNSMVQFAPYDIDGGANLAYFMKHPHGGWSYRKRTWEGPEWWPGFNKPPQSLEQVIGFLRSR